MLSRLLEKALTQYGLKEIPGAQNNPEIMKYFHAIGQDWVQGDETAWCSAFINWCAKQAGFEYTGRLNARSWLNISQRVNSHTRADIVVLWRENPTSWKGHVGIPVNEDEDSIWVLGGNQSNMVRVSPYPKARLLAYIKLYPNGIQEDK